MRPRNQPAPGPPPVDRSEVRRLIAELDSVRVATGHIHGHAAGYRLLELHYMAGSLVDHELSPDAPWKPQPPARTAGEIEALVDLFFERMEPGFSVETSPYYSRWRAARQRPHEI